MRPRAFYREFACLGLQYTERANFVWRRTVGALVGVAPARRHRAHTRFSRPDIRAPPARWRETRGSGALEQVLREQARSLPVTRRHAAAQERRSHGYTVCASGTGRAGGLAGDDSVRRRVLLTTAQGMSRREGAARAPR
jgi:hypothetical protein